MINAKPTTDAILSQPLSGHMDNRPPRRRYYPEIMEEEIPFSATDQDMNLSIPQQPPAKKPRLLDPIVVTPVRPSVTKRLASSLTIEAEIEQHRKWQTNAVKDLCLFILEHESLVNRYHAHCRNELNGRRFNTVPMSASGLAEVHRVFTHASDLATEIFIRPTQLRRKHLLAESRELKHITKNLWNHPVLDGYAFWAKATIEESMDGGGIRQAVDDLEHDHQELAVRKDFNTHHCKPDLRAIGLFTDVQNHWQVTPSFDDKIKERLLQFIQMMWRTNRQRKEQLSRSVETSFDRTLHWDPSYFYL